MPFFFHGRWNSVKSSHGIQAILGMGGITTMFDKMKQYAPFIALIAVMATLEVLRRHPEVINNENLAGVFVALVFLTLLILFFGDLLRGKFNMGDEFSSRLVTKKDNPLLFYSFLVAAILFCAVSLFFIISALNKKTPDNKALEPTTVTPPAAQEP